jgi:phosphoenolpyruvate carboxylase
MEGRGSLRDTLKKACKKERRINWVLEDFNIRTVTAHPTQFYPGSVLGIIQ